jgi:type I restriction enzyme S subunit
MTNNPTTYKDSPLGKIPSDWDAKELGEVFEYINTPSFSRDNLTSEKTTNEIYYIHYGDIHATYKSELLDFETETRVPFLKDEFCNGNFNFLKEGDLVIADASEDYQGICESIEIKNIGNKKVIGGLHTLVIRDKASKTTNGFRTYIFRNIRVHNEIKKLATGISVYGISKGNLSKLTIPLPPLPEQKAIARILGLMDTIINKNNQLIIQKELRKKWLMQQLLTGKKRLKGFDEEWKEYKISQLGHIVTGNTPSMAKPEYYGDKYCWATAFDFEGIYIDKTKVKLSEEGKKVSRIVPKGSILITCIASIGKNAIANVEMAFNQQINAIVPNANFNSEFIYYLIENSAHKLKEVAGAGAVQIINKSNFEAIKLEFPSIKEQTAIAKVLLAADNEIQLLKAKTYLLKQQKKGLMQQLLTGRKRLKIISDK